MKNSEIANFRGAPLHPNSSNFWRKLQTHNTSMKNSEIAYFRGAPLHAGRGMKSTTSRFLQNCRKAVFGGNARAKNIKANKKKDKTEKGNAAKCKRSHQTSSPAKRCRRQSSLRLPLRLTAQRILLRHYHQR